MLVDDANAERVQRRQHAKRVLELLLIRLEVFHRCTPRPIDRANIRRAYAQRVVSTRCYAAFRRPRGSHRRVRAENGETDKMQSILDKHLFQLSPPECDEWLDKFFEAAKPTHP